MDEERPRKRRTTKSIRSARTKRILERLREGFRYDEIEGREKLTERRVRQMVAEAREGREAVESAIHGHTQIARVGRAAPVAGEALSLGEPLSFGPSSRSQALGGPGRANPPREHAPQGPTCR